MDLQLRDRTALVTGASVGIGRGIARALAAEGVRVAVTARRVDKLRDLAAEIVAAGGHEPVLIEQDMYAEDAAVRVADAARAGLGHVDILVNNAGGSRSFKELHVSEAQWQEAITLNFHRPRQLADALVDAMIGRRWGRIVNVLNTGAKAPAANSTPTSVSRAAGSALTLRLVPEALHLFDSAGQACLRTVDLPV
jgi:3-oxoacyl-[acyl-carrier protein] reductase